MKYEKIEKFTHVEVLDKKSGHKYFIFAVHVLEPTSRGPYKNNMSYYNHNLNVFQANFVSDTSLKKDLKIISKGMNYKALNALFNDIFNYNHNYSIEDYIRMETS